MADKPTTPIKTDSSLKAVDRIALEQNKADPWEGRMHKAIEELRDCLYVAGLEKEAITPSGKFVELLKAHDRAVQVTRERLGPPYTAQVVRDKDKARQAVEQYVAGLEADLKEAK